jgi:hypothetical protein
MATVKAICCVTTPLEYATAPATSVAAMAEIPESLRPADWVLARTVPETDRVTALTLPH